MLTQEMKTLITNHSAGMVATINDDGTPSVSPKATTVILSDTSLAFGNLRSPGTLKNISKRPAVEICYIDVVLRTAVRVSGSAKFVRKTEASEDTVNAFQELWGPYIDRMSGFFIVNITAAEFILSPGYDIGLTEEELRNVNFEKLKNLYGA